MKPRLRFPSPFFGGKSMIAPRVWELLGDPYSYIEPFLGSGAVLLARPEAHNRICETVNDYDGMLCNVWRSLQLSKPPSSATSAESPVPGNSFGIPGIARQPDLAKASASCANTTSAPIAWRRCCANSSRLIRMKPLCKGDPMPRAVDDPTRPATEAALVNLLRTRYGEGYLVLPHVRCVPGFTGTGGRPIRTADAIVVGMWASRGLLVEGFEVKCSRSDLEKELAEPEKAEEIARFCDRWWLVLSDEELAKTKSAIPPAWGILAPRKRAGAWALVAVREAAAFGALPATRPFLSYLMRVAYAVCEREAAERLGSGAVASEAYERGKEDGLASGRQATTMAQEKALRAQGFVESFEKAFGMPLGAWENVVWNPGGEALGKVAKAMLDLQRDAPGERMKNAAAAARTAADALDKAVAALNGEG